MSNHQQVTIVRDTAESNGEVDALVAAQASEGQPEAQPQAPAADRPGWLPEKFQNPEDLAKVSGTERQKLDLAPKAFEKADMERYIGKE